MHANQLASCVLLGNSAITNRTSTTTVDGQPGRTELERLVVGRMTSGNAEENGFPVVCTTLGGEFLSSDRKKCRRQRSHQSTICPTRARPRADRHVYANRRIAPPPRLPSIERIKQTTMHMNRWRAIFALSSSSFSSIIIIHKFTCTTVSIRLWIRKK